MTSTAEHTQAAGYRDDTAHCEIGRELGAGLCTPNALPDHAVHAIRTHHQICSGRNRVHPPGDPAD